MSDDANRRRPRQLLPFLCRICLTKSHAMSNLTDFFDTDKTLLILKALEKVMNCDILITKEAPNHLCSMCLSLLRISYDLRIQFDSSQLKISENISNEVKNVSKTQTEPKNKEEVELIYCNQNYSLKDILIVEDEHDKDDYANYLEKLDKSVSVKVKSVDKSSEPLSPNDSIVELEPDIENARDPLAETDDTDIENEMNSMVSPNEAIVGLEPNHVPEESLNKIVEDLTDDDYEMIVIKTESDNEIEHSFRWEHEYAKTWPEIIVKKKGGRKSKYPELTDKINSLIIEGEVTTKEFKERKRRTRKNNRFTNEELEEIEKYIIYTGNDCQSMDEQETKKISQPQKQQEKDETKDITLKKPSEAHICDICQSAFVTKGSLNRHLRVVHKVEIQSRKREGSPQEIKWRRRREKLNRLKQCYRDNPMLCQICGHVSKSSGGAKYHSLTHIGKKIHCDLCPRTFFTPSHLKNHRESKHEKKEKKYLCPWCGEYRNSSSSLAYHMKVHNNDAKKLPCHLCGIKFVVKSALNTHLRRHNGDRRFPCQHCPKSFYSSNERNKHSMTHTGEKPHKCKYCDKRFIAKFNKSVHMMTHEGPYECDYCHKSFIDTDVLNIHLKYKHHAKKIDNAVPKLMLSEDEEDLNDAEILEGLELLPPEDTNLVFEED